MSEQGLKAVVYPELDPVSLDVFVKQLGEVMSNTNIPVGISPNAVQNAEVVINQTSNNSTTVDKEKDKSKKETSDAVKEGITDSLNENPEAHEKPFSLTNLNLTNVLKALGTGGAIALALGAGAVSVATMMGSIVNFLESVSPPLKNVMSLFSTAFNLIWMPIGTLLAIQMMPTLRNIFTKVGEWLSIAFDLYEKEGMAGIIGGAVSLCIDILTEFLSSDLFTELMATTLWAVLNAGLTLLLAPLIGPGNTFEYLQASLDLISGLLSAVWHLMTWDFDALGDDFEKIGGSFETMWKNLTEKIPDLVKTVVDWIKSNTPVGRLVDLLINWLDKSGSARESVQSWADNIGASGQKILDGDWAGGLVDLYSNTNVLGAVGRHFGWWADGGVVTRPTIAGVGEAGPEAIVPLSQLSHIANEFSNTSMNSNVSGGNVMNFYISGNNAMEIGEEVQKILEKSVGKSSSKMMWW